MRILLELHPFFCPWPPFSYQIPPESPFTPKKPEEIKDMNDFVISQGWLVGKKGPSLSTLPSLYCQVMLKEYHVTDQVSKMWLCSILSLSCLFYQISCMCLGRVYHTTEPLVSKRSSLLPLAGN